MSKLKKLSDEDLSIISNEFGLILEKEVSKVISTKELEDLNLDITLIYENDQLDVDVDLGVLPDKLSNITEKSLDIAIDEGYLRFDSFIDDNYRV